MQKTASLEEFIESASQMKDKKGKFFINQTDYTPEETLISDEDTAGNFVMQLVRLLIETDDDKVYFEYPVNESASLEEMNIQLEPVEETLERVVLNRDEMDSKIQSSQNS